MKTTRLGIAVLLWFVVALPMFGKTYKTTYPVSCAEVWPAVQETLSVPENYDVVEKDAAKMTAKYDVKHSAHVNISGAMLQRQNKVTLVPKGTACEMQVVSNYSGWEHNDQGDFKKRVEDAMAKPKTAPPSEPAAAAK